MRVPDTIDASFVGGPEDAPFAWDGKVHEEGCVEAFVVDVRNGFAHFVVTRVVADPHEHVLSRYGDGVDLVTAGLRQPWSADFPNEPRDLASIAETAYSPNVPTELDQVELDGDGVELTPGSMVRIRELLLWGEAAGHTIGHTTHELTLLPTKTKSAEDFFARSANLKPRLAAQLLRSFEKREQLLMQAQNRIQPNEPVRPFANPDECVVGRNGRNDEYEVFRSRNVFGAGPVKDHFVDIRAVAAPDYLLELGGQQNFTTSGRQLFTPNIIPFGEDSEGDPLYAVEIRIHSDSVMCPAVGEQRVIVMVDGVVYDALKNAELSSHYFEDPGHDVVMTGFRQVEQTADTYEITEEQSQALSRRNDEEHRIVMRVIDEAMQDGSFYAPDISPLDEEAERRVMAMRAKASEDNRVIATIIGGEPIGAVSSGASLLIPKSMLDSLEIMLPAIE